MSLVKPNPLPPPEKPVWANETGAAELGAAAPTSVELTAVGAMLCRPSCWGAVLAASRARESWVLPPKAGAGDARTGAGVAGVRSVVWMLALGALSCTA